jgi:hypothetical protein
MQTYVERQIENNFKMKKASLEFIQPVKLTEYIANRLQKCQSQK